MGSYKLSRLAFEDLSNIFEYGILKFGLNSAENYLAELEQSFIMLSDTPGLGAVAFNIKPGLRRYIFKSHCVFYMPEGTRIFIVRILHHSMDVTSHL